MNIKNIALIAPLLFMIFFFSTLQRVSKIDFEREQYRSSSDLAQCSVSIPPEAGSSSSGLEIADIEDFRNPGEMENDTLRITLETMAAECNPIVYKFEDTNWVNQMQRNSSYITHPDDLMAENFALLMEWRRSGTVPESVPGGPGEGFPVNDIGLLTEIEKVLTAGCGE